MTKNNLAACLAVTLPHEGGWSDHPKDPGGATMKGITLATFRRYLPGATKADLRQITPEWVELIYRQGYWEPVRGDDLPAGVDLAVFDFGVNSGPGRASKALQGVAGVVQDGKIGKATVTAVAGRDATGVVKALCARRLGFVKGLKTFSTFGRGWSRRIADVEAKGVAMALRASGAGRAVAAAVLAAEAQAALGRSKVQDKGAGTVVGGGAAGGAVAGASDVNWWIVAGVALAAAAVVALVKSRASINKDRAAAYLSASSED